MLKRKRGGATLLRDNRGTSLVEFAIALPFLVLVALGIIEIGRYTAYGIVVSNAVKAGATVGAVSETEAQATPDPNQPHSSGMDFMASQAACNDAAADLAVANPSFSCSSNGATSPTNGLKINTTITCTWEDGSADSSCSTSSTKTRIMYITVAAAGKFNGLLNYPFLPKTSTMSAKTTLQVGL